LLLFGSQSRLVQQLIVIKLALLGFQMDAARAINKGTASFLACFYRVCWLSGHAAPLLDPWH